MPTKQFLDSDIVTGKPRLRDCFGPTNDIPSAGKRKVYFRYAECPLIEADLSPGARLVQDGEALKLVEGHIRLMCPKCFVNGVDSALHIEATNKTVWVHQNESKLIQHIASDGNLYFLPTFSVLEPVWCSYREQSAGACTWRARIIEGHATDERGGGQIFLASR